MNARTTPAERGLALELRLERLFRANGYQVLHDVWRTGRSGVQHQIDVFAEYVCPLHRSVVIVEAKAYEGAVDKDRVMKLKDIVQDLGADRGILVTTNYFTVDARKTAVGTNIDLWDRDHLAKAVGELELGSIAAGGAPAVRVVERLVPAKVDLEQFRQDLARLTEKRSRGTLGFGKVQETLVEVRPVSYPYYEAELSIEVEETRSTGLFKKETIRKTADALLTFDAPTGTLVEPSPDGVSYAHGWISALTPDEIRILRERQGVAFSLQSLAGIGVTESRAKRAIASLLTRNIIEKQDSHPVTYRSRRSLPPSAHGIGAISRVCGAVENAELMYEIATGALVEPSAIISAVESYWPGTTTKHIGLLYYPYFCALYRLADGSSRVDLFDAVTGKPNEFARRFVKVTQQPTATRATDVASSDIVASS